MLIFMLKLDKQFSDKEHFKNVIFFKNTDLELESKSFFFYSS